MTLTAQAVRHAQAIALDTPLGLPPLPFIPVTWLFADRLSPDQQEANLRHVALWVVERDSHNFNMDHWHDAWGGLIGITRQGLPQILSTCGTVHCIAGFSQVMAGQKGFELHPETAGRLLLGVEAQGHFHDSNEDGLAFLQHVISRNSPGASA
jgi:hypothetical protein